MDRLITLVRPQRSDVVVIGLGAIGAATVLHLARAGARVVGIDRFTPPHTQGSSHGETRITRESICEGAEYIPLVRRSHQLWRAFESEAGVPIFTQCGGIIIDATPDAALHDVKGPALTSLTFAQSHGIAHESLTVTEARRRFPGFALTEDSLIYFEPGAGFLRPENAIRVQLELARAAGAELVLNSPIEDISVLSDGIISVRSKHTAVEARHCVIAAGAWIKDFIPDDMKSNLQISRQVLHWLPIRPGSYPLSSSPIFIWAYGSDETEQMYGFPSLDGRSIKVATELFTESSSPNEVNRGVSQAEQTSFFNRHAKDRLTSAISKPTHSSVCMYVTAPRSRFVITPHPDSPHILIASCCSGHGFKHSAAIGESLAAMLLERNPPVDLSAFNLKR